MNDKAQLYTLEGLIAAVLVTVTVLAIVQSSMVITPQTENFLEVQMKQKINDALVILDVAPDPTIEYNLTECAAKWNTSTEASFGKDQLEVLDNQLATMLPVLMYNVEFAYVENNSVVVKKTVFNGAPTENSITATRLVTLTNSTVNSYGGTWMIPDDEIKVVEVRLTAWHV
ncbi:hypothetical protein HNV12_09750 [Methanococcoides sp. SA1]|nr:hypothetical protein [Methanococcoides sp. SA1]